MSQGVSLRERQTRIQSWNFVFDKVYSVAGISRIFLQSWLLLGKKSRRKRKRKQENEKLPWKRLQKLNFMRSPFKDRESKWVRERLLERIKSERRITHFAGLLVFPKNTSSTEIYPLFCTLSLSWHDSDQVETKKRRWWFPCRQMLI